MSRQTALAFAHKHVGPAGGLRRRTKVMLANMAKGVGHVVLYMGDDKIVQCSGGKRGSNMGRSVTSPGQPTGWVRYDRVSGGSSRRGAASSSRARPSSRALRSSS